MMVKRCENFLLPQQGRENEVHAGNGTAKLLRKLLLAAVIAIYRTA
jgi:hypothetical protein